MPRWLQWICGILAALFVLNAVYDAGGGGRRRSSSSHQHTVRVDAPGLERAVNRAADRLERAARRRPTQPAPSCSEPSPPEPVEREEFTPHRRRRPGLSSAEREIWEANP